MRIYCENDYSDGHKSASTLDVDEFPEVDDEALDDYLHQFTGDGHGIVEVFPPESRLVDSANEYHLWVVPVGWEEHFPFCMQATLVATQDDMEATYGRTKARQRDWQPDIPTGLGCSPGEQP